MVDADDMGIDQIAVPAEQRSYGYTGNNGTIKTPNIYRLAAEGMVFQVCASLLALNSLLRSAG